MCNVDFNIYGYIHCIYIYTHSEVQRSCRMCQGFFKLEGLPLSLTVVKLDNSRLELRIVGLDCPEELQRLEVALQKLGQSGTPKER